MLLKDLKRLTKGMPGDLPVMVPDGNGEFVELKSIRLEAMEFADYDDGDAVLLEGQKDEPKVKRNT